MQHLDGLESHCLDHRSRWIVSILPLVQSAFHSCFVEDDGSLLFKFEMQALLFFRFPHFLKTEREGQRPCNVWWALEGVSFAVPWPVLYHVEVVIWLNEPNSWEFNESWWWGEWHTERYGVAYPCVCEVEKHGGRLWYIANWSVGRKTSIALHSKEEIVIYIHSDSLDKNRPNNPFDENAHEMSQTPLTVSRSSIFKKEIVNYYNAFYITGLLEKAARLDSYGAKIPRNIPLFTLEYSNGISSHVKFCFFHFLKRPLREQQRCMHRPIKYVESLQLASR